MARSTPQSVEPIGPPGTEKTALLRQIPHAPPHHQVAQDRGGFFRYAQEGEPEPMRWNPIQKFVILTIITGAVVAPFVPASGLISKGGRMTLELNSAKVTIDVPEKWEAVKDLFNLPITLLSPDHSPGPPAMVEDFKARRSALTLIPTGAKQVTLLREGLEKEQGEYFKDKKSDIESGGGVLLSKIPYHFESLIQEPTQGVPEGIHSIGVKFRIGTQTFTEISHYLVCDQQIFLLKGMIHEEDRDTDEKMIESMVRSFRCL
jgi:hypothetical protein